MDETKLIVQTARELGRLTYAHCSGRDGLEIAVAAGIDSIEHGFFMDKDILQQMADKGIAWVPTFCPVYFQYERPELADWNASTVEKLWAILARHFEHIALACEMGVPVIAGSDAGSYGVPHGKSLIDEMFFQRRAGMPVDKVLASATSLPRQKWKCASADIVAGNQADFIALAGSPFENLNHLRHVQRVCRHEHIWVANDQKGEPPMLTPRERLRAALNHQEADRIPLDFGSTAVTGIHVSAVYATTTRGAQG